MKRLRELLSRDHDRLDGLLAAARRADGSIDEESYAGFRRGLLRHIGIEERILFPLVRQRRGESELMRQLHRDHAALSALLVPSPDAAIIEEVAAILHQHNPLEEDAGGLYEVVEQLAGTDIEAVLEQVRTYPEVPMARYADTPLVRSNIEKLLKDAEAGRARLRDRRG